MKIYWRDHRSSGDIKRVWREDWPGDAFEIVTAEQFKEMEKTFIRFGFAVIKKEMEED